MDLRDQLQETLGTTYVLERELGGGGMSRVFVANETRLNRKVVIKVLSPELSAGVNVDRFEREIQLAASLQQANIVPIISAGVYETAGNAEKAAVRYREFLALWDKADPQLQPKVADVRFRLSRLADVEKRR